jgi:hypothetical protein
LTLREPVEVTDELILLLVCYGEWGRWRTELDVDGKMMMVEVSGEARVSIILLIPKTTGKGRSSMYHNFGI